MAKLFCKNKRKIYQQTFFMKLYGITFINTGVRAALFSAERGVVIRQWDCRLDDYSSVYEAEIYPILKIPEHIQRNIKHPLVQIYSDSLPGGLQLVYSQRIKYLLIFDTKVKLMFLQN